MDQIYIGKQSTIRLYGLCKTYITSYVRRIIRYLKNKCAVQCMYNSEQRKTLR